MSYDTASFARPMINPHARRRLLAGAAAAALVSIAAPATPAELQPRTIAAFGHYVQLSEATMNAGAGRSFASRIIPSVDAMWSPVAGIAPRPTS